MAVKYKASNGLSVEVRKMRACELQAGDLFSTRGIDYWERAIHGEDGCVGQRVYVRTLRDTPTDQENKLVYRLRFLQTEEEAKANDKGNE